LIQSFYFSQLSVGANPPATAAEANPEDYAYLCEDGSQKPVTGKACSWAQRPWQGYMGNGDITRRVCLIYGHFLEKLLKYSFS
jgi:hypothetical protein